MCCEMNRVSNSSSVGTSFFSITVIDGEEPLALLAPALRAGPGLHGGLHPLAVARTVRQPYADIHLEKPPSGNCHSNTHCCRLPFSADGARLSRQANRSPVRQIRRRPGPIGFGS